MYSCSFIRSLHAPMGAGLLTLLTPVAATAAVMTGTAACQSRSEAMPESAPQGADTKNMGVTRTSAGAVTVDLTPKSLNEGELTVQIRVDTHTVDDLDKYDLTKITTLEFDAKTIHPTAAPKLGGHHNSGKLTFPVNELPSAFAITIRGLDEPAVRTFKWP